MCAVIIDAIIGLSLFQLILMLAAFWPSLALLIRRCHDRARSGWFILLFFVPLLNLWPIVELYFLRGTVGPNEYGPDPLLESYR